MNENLVELTGIELEPPCGRLARRRNPESAKADEGPRSSNTLEEFGGADRDRTGDPLLAKQVLSQLSYSPTLQGWWAWVESNYRPHPYQGCALTN